MLLVLMLLKLWNERSTHKFYDAPAHIRDTHAACVCSECMYQYIALNGMSRKRFAELPCHRDRTPPRFI